MLIINGVYTKLYISKNASKSTLIVEIVIVHPQKYLANTLTIALNFR